VSPTRSRSSSACSTPSLPWEAIGCPAALLSGAALALAAVSFVQSLILFPFLPTFPRPGRISVLGAAIGYAVTHIEFAAGLPGHWWQRWHLASPKMEFYDLHLDNRVWYARHALSIDENRAEFDRVIWGSTHNKGPKRLTSSLDWLQQVWFAGTTPTSAAATPKTRRGSPTSRSAGWCTPR